MAAASIEKLRKRDIGCGGPTNEEWLQRGAAPSKENYRRWNLARQGIMITFGEYQIGPGCVGEVEVFIPVSKLKEIVRAKSALEKVTS
jgi:hypothetical protein